MSCLKKTAELKRSKDKFLIQTLPADQLIMKMVKKQKLKKLEG